MPWWLAKQAFLCDFGAKKDRGTTRRNDKGGGGRRRAGEGGHLDPENRGARSPNFCLGPSDLSLV